jgi:DNA-nicking Smr family endonuclease
VQRAIVHRLLADHPLVCEFHDDPRSHLGATLVVLRPRE